MEAGERHNWLVLAVVSFAVFAIMLDNTVVNVALPSIERDLGLGLSTLEWTVNAYVLTFAVAMLPGGRLADLFGRRRVFLLGVAIFAVASLRSGLAGSGGTLIAARAVQGIGAALVLPSSLSIVAGSFPRRRQGLAVGVWSGVSTLGMAIGPFVGGGVTQLVDWRWIFFVNVPVGVLVLVAGRAVIRESRGATTEQGLDLPGLALSAAALFALMFALIEAQRRGWGSYAIAGPLAAGVVGLFAFVALERRRRKPMLDLSLFRNLTFAGANAIGFLLRLSMFGVFFFLSLYMQNVLGYSAVRAGLVFLPMTVLTFLAAPPAGRLCDRFGPRWPMTVGMACAALALFRFSRLGADETFWTLLPALVLGGIGLALPPVTAAMLGAVPVEKAGIGSGVLNAVRQLGSAFGIAVMGAVLARQSSIASAGGASTQAAFLAGFHRAFEVSAGVAVVAVVVAAATIRKPASKGVPDAARAVGDT